MMLFFSAKQWMQTLKIKFRTSPVRNSITHIFSWYRMLKKRVSLPAFPVQEGKRTGSTRLTGMYASLSVEAALVFTLCLFSCALLMTPMKLLEEQRKIQAALDQASRDLSQYAYIKYQLDQGKEGFMAETGAAALVGISYARSKVMGQVDRDYIQQISFGKSRILQEDEKILLVMNYRIQLPFSIFGLSSIPMESVSMRRAWVGADGGRIAQKGKAEGENSDQVVYIGKNATRYHSDPLCHYLYNDLKAVSASQMNSLRNQQGEKYRACSRCGSAAADVLYVMPSGNRYHTSELCSAITAYVRAAKKSEVGHLGACSYCGGK